MPKLSIDFVIPTKGRRDDLKRGLSVLNAIAKAESQDSIEIGACISDSQADPMNCQAMAIIYPAINVTYRHNPTARSFSENLRSAIDLSQSEYCWLMGDDDHLLEGSISTLLELLPSRPSIIHFNAIIRNSHHNKSYPLAQPNSKKQLISGDVSLNSSIEDMTHMSTLVMNRKFLEDPETWSQMKNLEIAPHLRCLSAAFAGGHSYSVLKPSVVIEKTDDLVAEWRGSWVILIGYEIPQTRHHFLANNPKKRIKPRILSTVIQELRMHSILCVFRKSFPCLAEEASDFLHQYRLVRLAKRSIFVATKSEKIRRVLKFLGRLIDPRCKTLEI